ncbi:MAG: hypothetical protein LKI93_03370 [Bifidobacteriaceae bacterium]|jgi:amino acid permease|nr:hypothetical protein [Bifidobacteriaceae bacterium]
MTANNPSPSNGNEQREQVTKPTRDNVILIIAIVVAALNFIGVISAVIAFNWLSVILGLLNTLVWVAVILVQLRRASARRK